MNIPVLLPPPIFPQKQLCEMSWDKKCHPVDFHTKTALELVGQHLNPRLN